VLDKIIEHDGPKMKRSDIKSLINYHSNKEIDDLEISKTSDDIKDVLVNIDLEVHLSRLECDLVQHCLNFSVWTVQKLMQHSSKVVSLNWEDKLDSTMIKYINSQPFQR